MTKPWEENWIAEECDIITGSGECIFDEAGNAPKAVNEPRAQLASAAPDMARVLLAIEWAGETTDEGSCARCPSCGRYPPSKIDLEGEGHAADCALDAALRKAGVR